MLSTQASCIAVSAQLISGFRQTPHCIQESSVAFSVHKSRVKLLHCVRILLDLIKQGTGANYHHHQHHHHHHHHQDSNQ